MDSQTKVLEQLKESLNTADLAALGPESRPGAGSRSQVEAAADSLLRGSKLAQQTQELIRGLLLLWHDHLHEAHEIAQAIENPDGSLLHAIMHRREPDYSNSKYWLRRAGQHPCYATIAERTQPLLAPNANLAGKLVPNARWDAYAFVDACENVARRGAQAQSERELLQRLQKIEFETFLEHLVSGV